MKRVSFRQMEVLWRVLVFHKTAFLFREFFELTRLYTTDRKFWEKFCVNKDRVLQKFRSVMILLDSFVYRKHRPYVP
jgi:hypothetical protein